MASIKLKGDTSGEVIISAPSVAGASTLELQATNGTIATTEDISTFYNSLGNRNLIINGKMQVAQRGTSTTGLQYNNDNNYPCCDRWQFSEFGSASYTAAFTGSQDTDVPPAQGFANSFKLACTTADLTLEADTAVIIRQMIEGQNLQHLKYGTANAETTTLSFWVKSNLTGTFTIVLNQVDGAKYYGADYTINTANTWEKKTITIQGNTSNAIDNDNDIGLRVGFYLAVGSNYASGTNEQWVDTGVSFANIAPNMTNNIGGSTSNYINITAVQLEAGTTATPFEHLPYDMELSRCNRYFFNFAGTLHGGNYSSNGFVTGVFPTEMRVAPTITFSAARTPLVGSGFGYSKPEFFSGYMGANPYVANLAADAEL